MRLSFQPISLMLIAAILFASTLAFQQLVTAEKDLGHWRLAARNQLDPTPTTDTAGSTVSPCFGSGCTANSASVHNLPCTDVNGTTITAGAHDQVWITVCDVDFLAQDIYPFILAGSFEACLKHCDDYNQETHNDQCVGFVFAPDRVYLENDCYLKSSTNEIVSPSTIHLIGATLVPTSSSSSASVTQSTASVTVESAQPGDQNQTKITFGTGVKLLGTSSNDPTKHYVSHAPALPQKLATKLLQPGINIDLVTKYPLATDTGSWTESTIPFNYELANLSTTPRLSRDGGKGGNINGTDIFYFCDTSTFGDVEGPLGYMNGFVSSSAAVDVSRKALTGDAIELQDSIGQWQDDVGRLRGWIPLTTGEEAFNVAVSGQGYRYAIWPESSFIPFNESHSLIYAPIVYVEVDMQTQDAQFTSLGNTLVLVSVDPVYGPHADRHVKQLFVQDEVEWGSLGGVHAWPKDGPGSEGGTIYLFGQVEHGILVAKVPAPHIADRTAYTYWDGQAWSSTMPDKNSTAYLLDQAVMDFDLFYAPMFKTFFMVYLTPYADNTIYVRKLLTDHDILPSYMPDGSDDYVENILRYPWSEPSLAYQPPVPASGYIYAGSAHLGYFGNDDIANGGHKLLYTWTEHTEKDPNDPASGYAHKSMIID